MDEYITLGGDGRSSVTEKKSEFLGYCRHVDNEEQALAFIAQIRKKHADARHNVYAYLLAKDNIMRYSDDGEPQGTGGMPLLDVIRKSGFCDAVIVVTRYFGGILLGTGGLTRAYSAAAKAAVADAGIYVFERYSTLSFSLGYQLYDKLTPLVKRFDIIIDGSEYSDKVYLRTAVKSSVAKEFADALSELCSGNTDIVITGERFDRGRKLAD